MGLFGKQPRIPADMLRRLDIYGRAWLDANGVDPSIDVYEYCVKPFRMDAMADPDGFLSEGRPVRMGLPPGRDPVPGARGTDWFKVLAAETPIDAALFELPRLGEPESARHAPRMAGPGGVVDRIAHAVLHRDQTRDVTLPTEWTTCLTKVVMTVPGK